MTLSDRLQNQDNVKLNSESQVFVDIKRGRQEVKNARQLKQNLTSTLNGNALPGFVMRDDVDNFLNKVRSLGQYVENTEYRAALYSLSDVRMSGDKVMCAISDSCGLPDGTILIADWNNSCIKKLDKSYKTTERLNMPSIPWGICQTGEDEVAVALFESRDVQFVNVGGKLTVTMSFNVSKRCRSILCSRGELFVACQGEDIDEYKSEPGLVGVYSMTGSFLRKIQLDHRGQEIFSLLRHITASDNGNKLHIADETGGIINIDRQGNVLSTFSDGLQGTSGVCTVTDDNLLVCGFDSNNVLLISADGEMVTQLLGEEDGIRQPCSLLFFRGSSRLILTINNSDKIKVFNLKM